MTPRTGLPRGWRRDARAGATLAAAAALLVAVGVGVWWAEPLAERVDLGEASVELLDTVAVDGRVVVASLGGPVVHVDGEGTVWVGTDERAFAVRGAVAESLGVEDHILVVGRVREGDGARWLDAEALTAVRAETLTDRRRSGERPTVQPED